MTGAAVVLSAFLSGWLIEGGMARRSRRAIREELELRDLLGADSDEGRLMHEKMQRRVQRYARSPLRTSTAEPERRDSRSTSWLEGLAFAGISGSLVWVGVALFLEGWQTDKGQPSGWVMMVLFSLLSGTVLAVAGLVGEIPFGMVREKFSKRVTSDPTSAPTVQDQPSA